MADRLGEGGERQGVPMAPRCPGPRPSHGRGSPSGTGAPATPSRLRCVAMVGPAPSLPFKLAIPLRHLGERDAPDILVPVALRIPLVMRRHGDACRVCIG